MSYLSVRRIVSSARSHALIRVAHLLAHAVLRALAAPVVLHRVPVPAVRAQDRVALDHADQVRAVVILAV